MQIMQELSSQNIIDKFGTNAKDSGRSETQIAFFSKRIEHISKHLKENPKDFHSRHGLIPLVNKRKKQLAYLKRKNHERYLKVIADLKLRK